MLDWFYKILNKEEMLWFSMDHLASILSEDHACPSIRVAVMGCGQSIYNSSLMISSPPCILSSGDSLNFMMFISLLTSVICILIEFNNWKFHLCVGFKWQIFSYRRTSWLASVRDQSCPHVRESQLQLALRQTHCCPKLSPSVMLVVPLLLAYNICIIHKMLLLFNILERVKTAVQWLREREA